MPPLRLTTAALSLHVGSLPRNRASSSRLLSSPSSDYTSSWYSSSPLVSLPPLSHLLMKSAIDAVYADISSSSSSSSPPPPPLPQTSSYLRPLVIDATAGNGSDSAFLASHLSTLPPPVPFDLLSIDVQPAATAKVSARLSKFSSHLTYSVEERSHDPLLQAPHDPSTPIALAVYNLGYLPNAPHPGPASSRVQTQTSTTLRSVSSSCRSLMLHGTTIVTSYPSSNPEEHESVLALADGLARLSSKETWSGHW
eukprot:CAMPEP_0182463244 /NCGR_PEP_ID=MMETSP1319-20130603/7228_1 /TAXON_ID=172717 /ORGANISM="Bolidomonas pacifica, Strain RCC208" /LENGTH=252 /DNA_ID=CAMNT_0024662759 /DNA_START=146 /DNA_END=901 /DNA_ORIENTATION=+